MFHDTDWVQQLFCNAIEPGGNQVRTTNHLPVHSTLMAASKRNSSFAS